MDKLTPNQRSLVAKLNEEEYGITDIIETIIDINESNIKEIKDKVKEFTKKCSLFNATKLVKCAYAFAASIRPMFSKLYGKDI